MKNIRISLSVVVLFFVVGNFNGFAQGSIKEVKGAKDTKKELRDEAAITKDADKKLQDKTTSATAAAVSVRKESSDQVARIKEKLKKTTDPAERKELMAEIERLKGGESTTSPAAADKAGDVQEGQSKVSGTSYDKMKKYSDLKGREYGNARARDAKKMIEKDEAKMASRDLLITSGRDRVSVAKTKVNTDLEAGTITKEQAQAKLVKISKAEKSLKVYELRVREGKKKLADHKSQVSDYIKN